jgi:hypothetical protein
VVIGPQLEGTIQEAEYQRVFEAMTQEHADALIEDIHGMFWRGHEEAVAEPASSMASWLEN